MGKRDTKKTDESKKTKKKKKDDFDLVHMNGNAGKDNEAHEDDEEEKHTIEKPTKVQSATIPTMSHSFSFGWNYNPGQNVRVT